MITLRGYSSSALNGLISGIFQGRSLLISLHCRHNLILFSIMCGAAPRSLFWGPDGLNKILEVCFEFPFNLTG